MPKKYEPISEQVLSAEYEAVYRYALTLCRQEHEAQEITQETFLRAMSTKAGFAGESSLYTWLCAIAKNVYFNRCRKKKREVSLQEWEEPAAVMETEQQLEERDISLAIHQVLHDLSEPYKEVFSLRVFGQLPYREIAGLFGKTESWARVTYHRARKMMEETLRKDGIL
ncbi:MAG: RNA polymerase sigma factor [Ruminococcaceae bacterium]|nr:RNA polymerase sigma factor [Oscillospiraceae bacterium]